MYIHCICIEMLKQILKEVQSSNRRVSDLEKQLKDIQEGESSNRGGCHRRKLKPTPSPEVRVKLLITILELSRVNKVYPIVCSQKSVQSTL